jgi:hypothetical protein
VLITEPTRRLVQKRFRTRLLGEQMLIKGKADPINIHELLGAA